MHANVTNDIGREISQQVRRSELKDVGTLCLLIEQQLSPSGKTCTHIFNRRL